MTSHLSLLVLATLAAGGLPGCTDLANSTEPAVGTFAPSPLTNCHTDSGIQICVAKEVYVPLDIVEYTISNGFEREVFEDRCTGSIEGRRSAEYDWSGSFGGFRLCANYADHEDVLASMVPLVPGDLVIEETHFYVSSFAYTGEWRLSLQVLGPDGYPIRDEPFTSPAFRVEADW